MDPRHLELAAEFGQLTGTADLIAYLGLAPGATTIEAKASLRARRKKMQGMQGNPKYRREAVFLIKYSSAFESLLEDIESYKRASIASHEATQVPILEMAIQGALAGGSVSDEQSKHLRDMARRLSISDGTFDATLIRLTEGHNGASRPAVPHPFHLSGNSTQAPTAPPIRPRTHAPGAPPPVPNSLTASQTLGLDAAAMTPQLEIIGAPIRYVELGNSPVVHEIRVRHRGKAPVPARVSADAGWLTVSPKILDPTRREQTISVHVDSSKVKNPPQSAVVHIVTDRNGRASVVFEAISPIPTASRTPMYVGIVLVAVTLIVLAVLASQGVFSGQGVSATP
ncbi:MAG: hypothetical protein ACJAZO_000440 [Myxococcota bacterium]|jgi:hypothetical protein